MERKIMAGAVAATAALFSIGTAPPAVAAVNNQVVGIEESSAAPDGTEIAYTVTKILPSADPVAYPIAGQLYEATVMARAIQGTVVPVVPFFNARAESGANYPVLADVSGVSGAPLVEGATTVGKIYFDVVGDVPNSVVYNNGPQDLLTWTQPSAGGGGGGSTGGDESASAGGSQGESGSTGPNKSTPSTSGGEAGNTGEGGTEGGGGNLDSGGGSGAPNGDTGGSGGGG